jgi:transcriptional regulator with XRE-family HTH domain
MSIELKHKILSAMAAHDLTQEDIARATGVRQTTVSSWLQGITPRAAKLKKLTDYLASLEGGEQPPTSPKQVKIPPDFSFPWPEAKPGPPAANPPEAINALINAIDHELDYIEQPPKGLPDKSKERANEARRKVITLRQTLAKALAENPNRDSEAQIELTRARSTITTLEKTIAAKDKENDELKVKLASSDAEITRLHATIVKFAAAGFPEPVSTSTARTERSGRRTATRGTRVKL